MKPGHHYHSCPECAVDTLCKFSRCTIAADLSTPRKPRGSHVLCGDCANIRLRAVEDERAQLLREMTALKAERAELAREVVRLRKEAEVLAGALPNLGGVDLPAVLARVVADHAKLEGIHADVKALGGLVWVGPQHHERGVMLAVIRDLAGAAQLQSQLVRCAQLERECAKTVEAYWRSRAAESVDLALRCRSNMSRAREAEAAALAEKAAAGIQASQLAQANKALTAKHEHATWVIRTMRDRHRHLLGLVRAGLPAQDIEASVGAAPQCPSEDCRMCTGEACNLCGAGCWDGAPRLGDDPTRPPCEHDVLERHQDREPRGAR